MSRHHVVSSFGQLSPPFAIEASYATGTPDSRSRPEVLQTLCLGRATSFQRSGGATPRGHLQEVIDRPKTHLPQGSRQMESLAPSRCQPLRRGLETLGNHPLDDLRDDDVLAELLNLQQLESANCRARVATSIVSAENAKLKGEKAKVLRKIGDVLGPGPVLQIP